MPTYEYACRGCTRRFEIVQPITADPLTTCEECGGKLHRVLFPVGVVYKGTGFYTTDYARKNGGSSSEASESKTETKSEEKKETPAAKPADSTGTKD